MVTSNTSQWLRVLFVLSLIQAFAAPRVHAWSMPERALYELYRAGEAHERERRYDAAEEAYRELAGRAMEWNLPDWSWRALWKQGVMHYRQGTIDQAINLYQEAFVYRDKAREQGLELDRQGEWMLLDNLKQAYLLDARMNLALRTHWRMEDHARQTIGWVPVEVEDGLPYDAPPSLEANGDLELFSALVLNENQFRLLQGETISAIQRLKNLAARLERDGEESYSARALLVRAYAEQIPLMKYAGHFDGIDETAAKVDQMPDDPWVRFYRAAVQVSRAHWRAKAGLDTFDHAWVTAQDGIHKLEQEGHVMMAFYCRRYLPMMLAEAGRHEEALSLIEEMVNEAAGRNSPALPIILSTRAKVLGLIGPEAGRDEEFFEALRQHWRRATIVSVPYTYKYYAQYLYEIGARAEAERMARLGILQTDMFEEVKVRRDLELMVEAWRGETGGTASGMAFREVVQRDKIGSARTSQRGRGTPFDFLDLIFALSCEEGQPPTNVRVQATPPMRVELFDPKSNRLMAIDAEGNGNFDGAGEIAIRDSDRDGFPELQCPDQEGEPLLKLRVYPFSFSGDAELGDEVRVTLEIRRDGRWETWAETELHFGEDLN